MPLVDQISRMKQQGVNDEEIVRTLAEQGITPREISEALDQSRIKTAIGETTEAEGAEAGTVAGMQPSVMEAGSETSMAFPEQGLAQEQPIAQEIQAPYQEYAYNTYPEQPSQYPQEYAEYQYPQQVDTETITDIARQIVDEKSEKLQKQLQETARFKTESSAKIDEIDKRLRKIEMSIDKLQSSILGKIGEYWKNISGLRDEMHATQESFSKVLNPLSENIQELRKITGNAAVSRAGNATKAEEKRGKPRPKAKNTDGFEDYLR